MVMGLLFCLLDHNSPQLKDLEFYIVLPLLACLGGLLASCVFREGYDKHNDWEPD